jgi:hypothetical protein
MQVCPRIRAASIGEANCSMRKSILQSGALSVAALRYHAMRQGITLFAAVKPGAQQTTIHFTIL